MRKPQTLEQLLSMIDEYGNCNEIPKHKIIREKVRISRKFEKLFEIEKVRMIRVITGKLINVLPKWTKKKQVKHNQDI
ncbi:hypothetical protein CMI47_12785 [Candidatus Pacearchaeota archaeon]|nr:hypothetical protein [Candidatus Pacearchaeota archaeon]|tara:strand:+ start:915 stop:1148 length:234 start_codon:yes stop_codon:yes gene_type:complete